MVLTNSSGAIKNILRYMPRKCKLIHVSTDYIFDGKNASYSEDSLPSPINYYGKTKLEAENCIRSSQKKYIIIRTIISSSSNNRHIIS